MKIMKVITVQTRLDNKQRDKWKKKSKEKDTEISFKDSIAKQRMSKN